MSDESRRVLDLLAQGKITVDEADQLLRALADDAVRGDGSKAPPPPSDPAVPTPRFFRIHVHKTGDAGRRDKDVNIRIPIAVIRGGMRLGALIPGLNDRLTARMRAGGVDFDLSKIDSATIESLLKDLGEVHIDANDGREQVRITCE